MKLYLFVCTMGLSMDTMLLTFLLVLALITLISCQSHSDAKAKPLRYCSFFNNRAPKAQPGLRNCTWFKEESCCLQQEIQATFGRVKPLKGASQGCQKYINYLMCYICAPDQNLFYQNERLTVCKGFCDNLFDACGSAILKGSVIRDLYSSGEQFCKSRRFLVAETHGCFSFDDPDWGTSSGGGQSYNPLLILLSLVFLCGPHLVGFLHGCICQWPKIPNQPINRRCRGNGAHHQCRGNSKLMLARGAGVESGFEDRIRPTAIWKKAVMARPCYITSHRRSIATLFTLILISVNSVMVAGNHKVTQQAGSLPRLNAKAVQDWAQLISNDLTLFAKEGLKYEELQRFYDEAQYVTEYINGTDKLLQVREKLGM